MKNIDSVVFIANLLQTFFFLGYSNVTHAFRFFPTQYRYSHILFLPDSIKVFFLILTLPSTY